MILLTRKEELSRSDFKNWWLNEHSKLASKLPGLKKFIMKWEKRLIRLQGKPQ